MSCTCAETVNEKMAEAGKGGSVLSLTLPLDGSPRKPMLQVGRRGEPWKNPLKGNPEFVLPTYCPFCGERYEEPEAADDDSEREYYIHDTTRHTVGNSMVWWKWNNRGYVCDIRQARRFKAHEIPSGADLVAYPCAEIDPLVDHHVDIQKVGE